MTQAGTSPGLLFTAFEPSGDDHASAVIAQLRERYPSISVYAWGGPKMEAAGATIVERTGGDAVIGIPGPAKIIEHHRMNKRIRRWIEANRPVVHVPVDSPAANFPICGFAKRAGVRVVHLVAPQMWAWGSWRVRKLRRLTDVVLCLLPFEEDWFQSRGVKAAFIGHPLFDGPFDEAGACRRAGEIAARLGLPAPCSGGPALAGRPRLALMPGSRPGEMAKSFPILLDAFRRLQADFPATSGLVAATTGAVAEELRATAERLGGVPKDLAFVSGDTDAVVAWCDYALVVSGTVTLQVARQRRPMVTFYRPNRLMYHALGRWLVSTPHFTLPNLIAARRVVPELIPHFSGSGEGLAVEVIRLMRQPGYAEDQRAGLEEVCRQFEGLRAARTAADHIARVAFEAASVDASSVAAV